MEQLKFLSLVDIFSFNNAKNLSLTLEGEEMNFERSSIDVTRNTLMIFKTNIKGLNRIASVQMDRTPNEAFKAKAFYGNLVINLPITEWRGQELKSPLPKFLTYNFYCTF